VTLGVIPAGLLGVSRSRDELVGSAISGGWAFGVGVFVDWASFKIRRDLPQRTQYFRVGLFAFPQLGQVLKDHSSPSLYDKNYSQHLQ
jgi:hypothetical protein